MCVCAHVCVHLNSTPCVWRRVLFVMHCCGDLRCVLIGMCTAVEHNKIVARDYDKQKDLSLYSSFVFVPSLLPYLAHCRLLSQEHGSLNAQYNPRFKSFILDKRYCRQQLKMIGFH